MSDENAVIVQTPGGTLKAVPSADDEYPGIVVTLLDSDGKECGACVFEFDATQSHMSLKVWGHEDPDGDPIHDITMSEQIETGE